jgi:hypothetical protein
VSSAQRIYDIGSENDRHSPSTSSNNDAWLSRRHEINRDLYEDRPLSAVTRAFRLLLLEEGPVNAKITARLEDWSLDNHPAYQALSYTWGNTTYKDDAGQVQNQNQEERGIRIDGQRFVVAKNLHEALLCLRVAHQPRYLWIDAICINQSDVVEKSHQIRLMKDIYAEAESVIVWLGRSDQHSDIAMRLISNINRTHDRRQRLDKIRDTLRSRHYSFEAAYTDLFRRSYWGRTWVIQEIFSAKKISLQCGQLVISWKALVIFQRFLVNECYGSDRLQLAGMGKYHPWTQFISCNAMKHVILQARPFDTLHSLRQSRSQAGHSRRPPNLNVLLFEHWDALATDPLDKVFAILGLASDGDNYNINVDYTLCVSQVYTNVVREYIRLYRNLSIIIPRRPQNLAHYLPSWCPDWSSARQNLRYGNVINDVYPFRTSGRQYEASPLIDARFHATISPCGQHLTTLGWELDRIREISDVARSPLLKKGGIFDFTEFFNRIDTSQSPSMASIASELDIWYAIHRRALRRGYRAERDKGLADSNKHGFYTYCRKKHDEFFRVLVRASTAITLQKDEWPHTEIRSKWREMLSDWRRHRDLPPDLIDPPEQVMNPRLRRSLRDLGQNNVHGGHKCFFATETGLLGLAPNGSRRGDTVCILRGCYLPVVLRSHGEHWKMVGTCYVCGFMHGQFRQYIQHCRVIEREFEIS